MNQLLVAVALSFAWSTLFLLLGIGSRFIGACFGGCYFNLMNRYDHIDPERFPPIGATLS